MAKALKTKPCSVTGCAGPARARGLCTKHYHRWERHGDPLGGNAEVGEPMEWLTVHSTYRGDECLRWPFIKSGSGIGSVWFRGRSMKASRVMCTIAHGEPPAASYEAAHSCGNGHLACVNPKHLRWATTSENQMDRIGHGTSNRGSKNGQSILTESQVVRIKQALMAGKQGKLLAAEFEVSPMAISAIKRGTTWAWVKA